MNVMEWLLDSDPSIRWQVMRDLTGEPAEAVAAERAKVATEGWGARLLALQDTDGQWGKDVLPASTETSEEGLPDVATRKLLRDLHRISLDDLAGFLGLDTCDPVRIGRTSQTRMARASASTDPPWTG